MQRIIRTAARFVCFVMLAAVCLRTVPAFAGTLTTTDADVACSTNDLLQTLYVSGSFTGKYSVYGPTPWWGPSYDDVSEVADLSDYGGLLSLRDGVALTNYTDLRVVDATSNIWTYTLDTTVNTFGYDLSQVNIYHGHYDDGRDGQAVKVEFSKVATPDTYVLLYDMGLTRYDPPSNYGKISIAAVPADGATGVKKIRITFNDVENDGGGGVSEIDVLGTATADTRLHGGILIVR